MSFITDYGVFLGNLVFTGFEHFTTEAEETQKKTLLKILNKNKDCELGKKYHFDAIDNIKEFQANVPLSTFEDYAPLIDRMVENGESNIITSSKIVRYSTSSGSVGKPKLQPKTARDLWNMQCMGFAATPACASRWFKKKGKFKKLPTQMGPLVVNLNAHKLENGLDCAGAAQAPFSFISPLLKFFTTTPKDILYPEDSENTDVSYFQLRFALECRDVTYIGSIVITLLTTMFEYLEENWEILVNDIENGTIDPSVKCPDSLRKKYEKKFKPNPKRAAELRKEFERGFETDVPIAKRIWPKLCWGYGMIGSTLAAYVNKLRRYVGDLPMHNMGYGASEGFMAMPVELNVNDAVILPRSLFYEFLPVDAPEGTTPLTISEVEVGKDYEIIITNFSGLYRYRLLDVVRITGMYNNSPRVEFLYRTNIGMNLANEKTTTQMLDFVAQEAEKHFGLDFIGYSYFGDANCKEPHYNLFVETKGGKRLENTAEIEQYIDDEFRKVNEKYDKYRTWNMIHPAKVLELKQGSYEEYKKSLEASGKVLNQIKPITVINTPEREQFFFTHLCEGQEAPEYSTK